MNRTNLPGRIRLANLPIVSYARSGRVRGGMGPREILSSERGQAMTEYAIVFCLAVIPLAAFITPLRIAITNYLRGLYFFISLPIF